MKVLLTETELRAGVERMAARLNHDYAGRPLTILGVMTGSVVLLADLIRLLRMPLRVGVVQASSYRGETSRGALAVNADLMPDIAGRNVLLVDDIFDTGHTLVRLREHLADFQPREVRSAVLLLKQGRQEVDYRPEYAAFDIPDLFVVGYGLDYRDEYRNLPFVAALEPAEIDRPADSARPADSDRPADGATLEHAMPERADVNPFDAKQRVENDHAEKDRVASQPGASDLGATGGAT